MGSGCFEVSIISLSSIVRRATDTHLIYDERTKEFWQDAAAQLVKKG
jgi:hypothetical protein